MDDHLLWQSTYGLQLVHLSLVPEPPPPQKKTKPSPCSPQKGPTGESFQSILSTISMIGLMKDRRLDLGALQGLCVFVCVALLTSVEFHVPRDSPGNPRISSLICLLGGDIRHWPMDVVLPEVIWFKERWIVATLHGLSQDLFLVFWKFVSYIYINIGMLIYVNSICKYDSSPNKLTCLTRSHKLQWTELFFLQELRTQIVNDGFLPEPGSGWRNMPQREITTEEVRG